MEIKVEVKLLGLEPLVEAIKELAVAHSTSALQATEAIGKAAKTSRASGKTANAAATPKEDPVTDPKPDEASATTATQRETQVAEPSVQEPQVSSQPVYDSPSEVVEEKKSTTSDTPTSDQASATQTESATSQSAPAGTASISDEKLREIAGAAAKKDREKVKAIVNKYAPTVSAIPQDKRAECVAELEAV